MSGGSSGSSTNTIEQLHVQGAQYNVPILLIYGQARIAANVVWAGGFIQKSTPAGGKGSGSSTSKISYTCAAIFSMGLGPVAEIVAHWNDGAFHGYRTYQQMIAGGWEFFLGEPGQPTWTYLTNQHPNFVLNYSNLAIAVNSDIQLGATPNLPQYNWEVAGFLQYGGANNILDALPSAVVMDLINNDLYGLGVDATSQSSQFDAYCIASNTFISPVLDSADNVANWCQQFVDIAHGGVVWSEGILKFSPYFDQPVTGNGVTYTPDLTPVYNLGADDFMVAEGDDALITVDRKSPQERYNAVNIEFVNRGSNYKIETAEAKSQGDIDFYTLRREPPRTYHPITQPGLAAWVAQLKLLWNITVRNTYKFKLQQRYLLLDPLDIVSLTDATLGLVTYPVRITSISEDADTGILDVEAEDLGTNFTPGYGRQVAGGAILTNDVAIPASVNVPAIIEPTSIMVGGIPEIWIGLSGQEGNLNWGGCHIYWSEDGTTYTQLGQVAIPAVMGTLLATLNGYSGTNPDTADTLSVDVSESDGLLFSIATPLAAGGNNLCWVGNGTVQDEFLSFDTQIAGAAAFQYEMGAAASGNLYRNLFDSNPTGIGWSAGIQFCYLGVVGNIDSGIFQWEYPTRLIGETIYFKFTSFNASNDNEEDISSVTAYPYTVLGTAYSSGTASAPGTPTGFGNAPLWAANTSYLEDQITLDSNGNGELAIAANNVDWNYSSPTNNHPGLALVDFAAAGAFTIPSYTGTLSASQAWVAIPVIASSAIGNPLQNIGVGVGSDSVGTSVTIAVPSGYAFHDWMYAQVVVHGNPTITPPAGWGFAGTANVGTSISMQLFAKECSASEPASYTWTLSASLAHNGSMVVFRNSGGAGTGPTTNTGTSTSPSTNSFSNTFTGAQILMFFGWASTATLALGGTSGSSPPTWNPTVGGTTIDGTITWENIGAVLPYSQWATIASTTITMSRAKDIFNVHFDLADAYNNLANLDAAQWQLLVTPSSGVPVVAGNGRLALQVGAAGLQDIRAIFSRGLKGYSGALTVAIQLRVLNGSGSGTFQFVATDMVLTAAPQIQRSTSGTTS